MRAAVNIIPRVNTGTREKIAALNKAWQGHKATAMDLIQVRIPAFNRSLEEAGIGVLYLPELP